jgi:hypothetical protein
VEDAVWDGGSSVATWGGGYPQLLPRRAQADELCGPSSDEPIINIEGDHATGEWKLLQPCTLQTNDSPRAMRLAAIYHDQYVKTPAGWNFQNLKVRMLFFSPHDQGWVKTRVFKP